MANNAQHPQIPLLLTRPIDSGRAFWDHLPAEMRAKMRPVFNPLIQIEPLAPELPTLSAVIFTSAQAVRLSPVGAHRTAFCVGTRTTMAAQKRGWDAACLGQSAAELIDALKTQANLDELTHLSGTHTRGDIAQTLTLLGLPTQNIALYDQHLCPLSETTQAILKRQTSVIVPLFSPRTARHFANQTAAHGEMHVVALSSAVADALPKTDWPKVQICASPTRTAMVKAIKKTLSSQGLG